MRLFYELDYNLLSQWLAERRQPRYRADQVLEWAYQYAVGSFEEMTNLPAPLREELAGTFKLDWPRVVEVSESPEASKYLLAYADGANIECVSIRMDGHCTCCLSSQVGCGMGCVFCASALGGLQRNLTTGEIVAQALAVQRCTTRPRNLVFMGIGEPLANLDNVLGAIKRFTERCALGLSPRRITVSTMGLVPEIRRLADLRLGVELAVSLNATTDEQRAELMPGPAHRSLEELIEACQYFTSVNKGQPVTFSYVLMKGVNDFFEDADRLAALLRPLRHHLNVIPFNPVEHATISPPGPSRIKGFVARVRGKGLNVSVRRSRGAEVNAACGQLRHRQNL